MSQQIQNEIPNRNQKYKIYSITLENFRTFTSKTIIGPFHNITGLIGPNGVGKSTIIESFCFILCKDIFLKQNLYDYEHLQNHSMKKKSLSVQLELQSENPMKLERTLKSNNESEFSIDNKIVSQNNYLQNLNDLNLKPFQILTQEEKTLFTSKNSQELTDYFERVCGSIEFKKDCEKTQKKLKNIDEKIQEKSDILKNLKKDKRNANYLITCKENAEEIIKKIENISQEIFELNLAYFHYKNNESIQNIEIYNDDIEKIYIQIDQLSSSILLERDRNCLQEKQNLQKKCKKQIQKKYNLEEKIKEIEKIIGELKNDIEIHQKDKNILYEPKLKIYQKQEEEIQYKILELMEKQKQLEQNFGLKIKFKKNQNLEEFLINFNYHENQLKDLEKQNEQKNTQIQENQDQILKLRSQTNKIFKEIEDKKANSIQNQNDLLSLEQEQKQQINLEQEIKEKQKQLTEKEETINELEKQKKELYLKIESKQTSLKYFDKDKQLSNILSSRISGFVGSVGNMINSIDRKYSLAIGMAFKRILDYLIVEKKEVAFEISEILKTQDQQKKLIILDNAPKKDISIFNEFRAKLDKDNFLAFDLIEFKTNNQQFIDYIVYFLRNVVISQNYQSGLKIKEELSDQIKTIITIDGEIIQEDGVESIGNKQFLPYKVKIFLKKELENENENWEMEILKIEKEIEKLRKMGGEMELMSFKNKQAQMIQKKITLEEQFKNQKNIIKNYKIDKKILEEQLSKIENLFNNDRMAKKNLENQILEKQNELEKQIEIFIQKNKEFDSKEQMKQIILQNKDTKIELILINEIINNLKLKLQINDQNLVKQQINNIVEQIKTKENKIEELLINSKQIEEKIHKIESEYNFINTDLKNIELKLNDQEIQKRKAQDQIKQLEDQTNQISDKRKTVQEDYQRNKVKIINYLEDEEIKGKKLTEIQKQILKTEKTILNRTQTQNLQELNLLQDLQIFKENDFRGLEVFNIEKMIEEKNIQFKKLEKKMENLTMNLDDQNMLDDEKKKVEELTNQLKQAKEETEELLKQEKELKQQLQNISQQRGNKLKLFLNPLTAIINNFYKFVNCDERAQASLLIENPFQQFQGGVIFSAIPPQKAFTIGTDSLSSGESSLANLSLFLALNEVQNSNFVIFDEIDANLDFNNILKFISTFGKYSQNKQIIFVTHKPYVYKHAEVLLGITKHHTENCSVCFSFDLQNFNKSINQLQKMDQTANKITEYVLHEKYKMSLFLCLALLIVLLILDAVYGEEIMTNSIEMSKYLQTLNIQNISSFFSYYVFFSIFCYVVFIFTIRKNIEYSFTFLFNVFFLIYIQGILKLVFIQERPVFLSTDLSQRFCYCDYGKPSGHSLTSAGIFLLIYNDIKQHTSLTRIQDFFLKNVMFITLLLIMISRMYFGAHSHFQCLIGAVIGLLSFFFLRRIEDFMLKRLFWPLFNKERFKNKNAFALLSFLLIITNYIFFVLWAHIYTNKEFNDSTAFKNFKSCLDECIKSMEMVQNNFSSKILKETLVYNYYFGILLGIFLGKEKIFSFKGLYADDNISMYFIRLGIFLLFIFPMIFAIYPKIEHNLMSFARCLLITIIVGTLSMTVYLWTLKWLNLLPKSGKYEIDSNAQEMIVT